MKKVIPLLIIILFFSIGYFISVQNEKELHLLKRSQIILGTLVEIQLEDDNEEILNNAFNAAFYEIKKVDSLFTNYNRNSCVSIINVEQDTIKNIPDEIFKLIQISNEIWKKTNGAFDASLNNLIKIWGFDSGLNKLPDDKKIKEALEKSGWENIQLLGNNSLIKGNNIQFNFGGIAKGYAVDKAIEKLIYLGMDKALVNAGGEIKTFGGGWLIGIQNPRTENEISARLSLNGKAVATSGDYENYFIENGKRYNHIINPKTGYPAGECRSVTIIADDCTIADAYSTGIFVMGVEKGLELIEKIEGLEGFIIDIGGKEYFSSGFRKFQAKK
jgi:thiamine biosynthesis lipoprotein